ncbi:glycosyltransferase [Cupriavidus sp. LEh25]|nr:glycosyltransferase [Cupriavidus sp. LEh25]
MKKMEIRHLDGTALLETGVNKFSQSFRVVFVVEAAGGGVAVHLVDMIRGLVAKGVEVHLIAPSGARFDASILTDQVIGLCTSFVRVPMHRNVTWRDLIAYFHVFRQIIRIRPAIVHSHSSKAGVLARLCLGSWQQVYTPHALYTLNPYLSRGKRRFYGAIERWFGRIGTDRLIAVSKDEAEHARNVLAIPSRITTTIYNGIPSFSLLSQRDARKALRLEQGKFYVGFVGRLEFQKGIDRLVSISRTLYSKFGEGICIVIIGSGDIEVATGLRAVDLPANVRFLGPVPQARQYFAAFDIFALASRYEGFPYVYLEAMAAYLPIVTTRVPGAEELVSEEGIGIVVENTDEPLDFADAIQKLFENSELRGKMRVRCTEAVARYSASEMVERTLKVYASLGDGSTE